MNGPSFILFFLATLILVLFLYYVTMAYSHSFSRHGRNIMYRDFYECGFKTIPDIRFMLDIQFSVIGIIFLIYDMEIVLITPLLVNLHHLPITATFLALSILFILGISYWYEWEHHTLNWSLS